MSEGKIESSFLNIKIIIILGVLLATSIIGGLSYYFATNKKPSEEPTQEVIEDDQETENNNKENIEKQEEIIIKNEYIPVIDCSWLNTLVFVIVVIISISISLCIFYLKNAVLNPIGKIGDPIVNFAKAFVLFVIIQQVINYAIWFIFMLIFAAFSKIWDEEHSWWSNVVKGFLRNGIYNVWLLLILILLLIISLIPFVLLQFFLAGQASLLFLLFH